MKKIILLIPLALVATLRIRAQSIGPSTVNAAGKTAIIAGNEFDWSVGEMSLVSTATTNKIIVTQGVLQPDDNLPSGVKNTSLLPSQLLVFPNPATSVVNIQYAAQDHGILTYKLLDLSGKIISTQTINVTPGTNTGKVSVADLACATYMLNVIVNSDNAAPQSISYKIQKLK